MKKTVDQIHLPVGNSKAPIPVPHFPARHQAFLWRNWGLVPVGCLAEILQCDSAEVLESGLELGLSEADAVADPVWRERGYMTLIRRNWHLLPYDQLLVLLGWNERRLHDALMEDDFLWHKMGMQKPACEPLRFQPLSVPQRMRTRQLREALGRNLPSGLGASGERPFAFLGRSHRSPHVPVDVPFGLRLAYSSNALYGDPLIDESGLFCQDAELEAMASWGINAVWFQAILYKLYPWGRAPGLSEGWEHRMESLRALIHRATRHGIKVFLYLNEPRNLPTTFFDEHPDLKGADFAADECSALCTSVDTVRTFLRDACAHVFAQAPGLGGAFTITMSENLTNCYSKGLGPVWGNRCSRCEPRDVADVVSEVNREIEAGIHSVSPEARVIAWTWGWKSEWAARAVDLLPGSIEVMCVSELGIPVVVGGVAEALAEYYISHPGPGPTAKGLWSAARARGLKCIAKIQINTTWECAAVPYLPVPGLVEEHLEGLRREGVDGLMMSWTLGAYLGGNLGLLGASAKELAQRLGGANTGPEIEHAWKHFADALEEFPVSNQVLYVAPQNFGPGNLLHQIPTGYRATMLGFCYDDLTGWRANYPEAIFQEQFEKLAARWNDGLMKLEAIQQSKGTASPEFAELLRVARTIYCQYRSVALQAAYVRERDRPAGPRPEAMEAILNEEIILAGKLLALASQDSRIGYEPTCHYFYTANDLKEKIINCEYLRSVFSTIKSGQGTETTFALDKARFTFND